MPTITSKKLLKFLKKRKFYIHHQTGGHIVLKSIEDSAKRVTIPMHNSDMRLGTIYSVLKQAGIDKKELFK